MLELLIQLGLSCVYGLLHITLLAAMTVAGLMLLAVGAIRARLNR